MAGKKNLLCVFNIPADKMSTATRYSLRLRPRGGEDASNVDNDTAAAAAASRTALVSLIIRTQCCIDFMYWGGSA